MVFTSARLREHRDLICARQIQHSLQFRTIGSNKGVGRPLQANRCRYRGLAAARND